MIAEYTAPARSKLFKAPRQYALPQQHKHLAEMQAQTGLPAPAFCPVVGDFYSGMQVTVPLFANQLAPGTTPANIAEVYRQQFGGPVVQYATELGENGFLSAAALSGYDSMKIAVSGNSSRILLLALYDNLGKGASGAAIECLNLALGRPPEQGLRL